jgi:hypothetical protein
VLFYGFYQGLFKNILWEYMFFLAAVEPCTCFPKDWSMPRSFFTAARVFSYYLMTPEDLIDKLKRTGDYVIVGEKESKEVIADSDLSLAPLLRSKGTGPDRDNPLILVRGAKS